MNVEYKENEDEMKFYETTKDLNFKEGFFILKKETFIKEGTSFIIEGYKDGKYALHFEANEENKYHNSVGDNYYFGEEEIKKFAKLCEPYNEQFQKVNSTPEENIIENNKLSMEEWTNEISMIREQQNDRQENNQNFKELVLNNSNERSNKSYER